MHFYLLAKYGWAFCFTMGRECLSCTPRGNTGGFRAAKALLATPVFAKGSRGEVAQPSIEEYTIASLNAEPRWVGNSQSLSKIGFSPWDESQTEGGGVLQFTGRFLAFLGGQMRFANQPKLLPPPGHRNWGHKKAPCISLGANTVGKAAEVPPTPRPP